MMSAPIEGSPKPVLSPAVLLLWTLLLPVAQPAPAEEVAAAPVESGLTVNVNVRLLFIDVEAVDADGKPMPGLTRDDFSLKLNSKSIPIYSVDDLCGCATEDGALLAASSRPTPPQASFVMLFDLAHLWPDGVAQGLTEAERWLRDVKQPDDRVLVAVNTSEDGIRQLCPLTADDETLEQALARIREDPELSDTFALDFGLRLERCRSGTVTCHNSAMQEFRRANATLDALQYFLTRLEALRGRKTLFLFHQNSSIYPAKLYARDRSGRVFWDGEPTDSVPDLEEEIDEVGGTAFSTGTTMYPLTVGVPSAWAVDFNDRLAGLTGGRASDDDVPPRDVLETAGRGCACMYRLGLELPKPHKSKLYRASIGIGDDYRLPRSYRVEVLSDFARWHRSSAAVLLDPESSADVSTAAAIVPLASSGNRWDVGLQVVVDSDSLSLIPSGTAREARWEVGALLAREGGSDHWEMLGESTLRCGGEGRCGPILHERQIEGLRPGRYELRAFVRDRWSDAFGGARAVVELPDLGETTIVGPLLVAPEARYLSTTLPLRNKREQTQRATENRISEGFVLLPEPSITEGSRLALLSWVCDRRRNPQAPDVRRVLSFAGAPTPGLRPGDPDPEGHCRPFSDIVETAGFAAGRYDYAVRWTGGGVEDVATARFAVVPPAPSVATATVTHPARSVEPEPNPVGPAVTAAPQSASTDGGNRPDVVQPVVPGATSAAATLPPRPPQPSTPPEPTLRPSDLPLEPLLAKLAAVAARYRDNALRFTCEESIAYRHKRGDRLYAFDYIYAYDDRGMLQDYRVARQRSQRSSGEVRPPRIVDLEDTALPVYALRAYSSIFIFESEHQDLYAFEVVGEDRVLGRPAVKIRLEAVPPYVEGVNDWVGAVWVDRDSYELLRFSGMKVEDHAAATLFSNGIEQADISFESHSFDAVEVDFDAEAAGMRFPSKVLIRRTVFATSLVADYLRSPGYPAFEIEQTYDNYRIYGVRTRAEGRMGVKDE